MTLTFSEAWRQYTLARAYRLTLTGLGVDAPIPHDILHAGLPARPDELACAALAAEVVRLHPEAVPWDAPDVVRNLAAGTPDEAIEVADRQAHDLVATIAMEATRSFITQKGNES
jgi:hypothetical protein